MNRALRMGVVGVGHMGARHARELLHGSVRGATLAAVCDSDAAALEPFSSVPQFSSASALFRSGLLDAVVIATPHYAHTPLSIEAIAAGLHVLTEKPLAVHGADVAKMLLSYEQRPDPNQVFAVMLNLRAEPRFLELREWIRGGKLGAVQRISWTFSDCFRTEAYYRERPWRGTWRGEGGGLLLNQAPHALDLWQWIFGMPARVHAFCEFGRFHRIEVEDQVTAYLDYGHGKTGVFIGSTSEAPGTNRLEVVAELGTIVLDQGELTLTRNHESMCQVREHATAGNAKPTTSTEQTSIAPHPNSRKALLENFASAALHGETLIAPAQEGLPSVELANAMIHSSRSGRTVELPLDPALYVEQLERLIRASTG